jgi:FkbM family methyltransferase
MLQQIARCVKRMLPDGRIRNMARHAWHTYTNAFNHREEGYALLPARGGLTLRLTRGPYTDDSIYFPGPEQPWIHAIAPELIGYFPNGRLLPPHSVLIDAGTFPADLLTIAARNGVEVYALEPDKANYVYSERVMKANLPRRAKVHLFNYALSDRTGKVPFWQHDTMSTLKPETLPITGPPTATVQTVTLDDLAKQIDPIRPLYVKMDIEGAELDAMAGAQRLVERGAIFMIAAYHVINGEQTAGPLRNFFRENDYSCFSVNTERHLTLWAFPERRGQLATPPQLCSQERYA